MNPVDYWPTEGTKLCSEEGGTIYFLGLRQWAPEHSMSHFNFILRNNKPIGNAIFLLPERTES